ncbi:sulfurtransferase TusA family protein [Allorhizobium undicola]|uniref:sulfurtransferase TusA family protein n=1 Tax=Allorhizobium undicola TaxID=78527 RepID=UPI000685F467|nr:sulfurtransferase TusA family protein [Allorhizobium undicola]
MDKGPAEADQTGQSHSAPTPPVLDLRGLKCPLPALKTRKRLKAMAEGQELLVETTDPMAVIDIPHMCREDGHVMVNVQPTATGHRFLIVKGSDV